MNSRRVTDRRRRRRGIDFEPGTFGAAFWAEKKAHAETRMAIIDEAPEIWRQLVNEFDPFVVADLAGRGLTAEQVRRTLTRRLGLPPERLY